MGTKPYPADGEIFELTLDGSAPGNRPLEMVRGDGRSIVCPAPERLRPEFSGIQKASALRKLLLDFVIIRHSL